MVYTQCLRWNRANTFELQFSITGSKNELVTNNTAFFPTFQVGFFDFFLNFFMVAFYIKVLPIFRLTDSSSFLFTLKSLIFSGFFFTHESGGKTPFNMSTIVLKGFCPPNHELEHFTNCMRTKKLGVISGTRIIFGKSYKNQHSIFTSLFLRLNI